MGYFPLLSNARWSNSGKQREEKWPFPPPQESLPAGSPLGWTATTPTWWPSGPCVILSPAGWAPWSDWLLRTEVKRHPSGRPTRRCCAVLGSLSSLSLHLSNSHSGSCRLLSCGHPREKPHGRLCKCSVHIRGEAGAAWEPIIAWQTLDGGIPANTSISANDRAQLRAAWTPDSAKL